MPPRTDAIGVIYVMWPEQTKGIGGLDAGVQRAHETDEEMRHNKGVDEHRPREGWRTF